MFFQDGLTESLIIFFLQEAEMALSTYILAYDMAVRARLLKTPCYAWHGTAEGQTASSAPCEQQREKFRDSKDSRDSSSEKTPFVMTPFSGLEKRYTQQGGLDGRNRAIAITESLAESYRPRLESLAFAGSYPP